MREIPFLLHIARLIARDARQFPILLEFAQPARGADIVHEIDDGALVGRNLIVRKRDVQNVARIDPMRVLDLRVRRDDLVEPDAVAHRGFPHRVARHDGMIDRRRPDGKRETAEREEQGESDVKGSKAFRFHSVGSFPFSVLRLVSPETRRKNEEKSASVMVFAFGKSSPDVGRVVEDADPYRTAGRKSRCFPAFFHSVSP